MDRTEYYERLDFEHNLINRRLTWLLTSQTILFAAYGLALDSKDKSGDKVDLFLNVIAFSAPFISLFVLAGVIAAFLAKYHTWQKFRSKPGNEDEPFGVKTWITYLGFAPDVALPLAFTTAWAFLVGNTWFSALLALLFLTIAIVFCLGHRIRRPRQTDRSAPK